MAERLSSGSIEVVLVGNPKVRVSELSTNVVRAGANIRCSVLQVNVIQPYTPPPVQAIEQFILPGG